MSTTPLVPRLRQASLDVLNGPFNATSAATLLTEAADMIEEMARIMAEANRGWMATLNRLERLEAQRCTCIDVRGVTDRKAVLIPGDELCPIHARPI